MGCARASCGVESVSDCSVLLQCVVAVCDAVLLQCVAVEQQLNRMQARILMCGGRVRLQCVAACCSMLQRVAACGSAASCS